MRNYLPARGKGFNAVFPETTTPAVCRAIRSVICLLDEAHLRPYEALPTDLVFYYRASSMSRQRFPLTERLTRAIPVVKEDGLSKFPGKAHRCIFNSLQGILLCAGTGENGITRASSRLLRAPGVEGTRGGGP